MMLDDVIKLIAALGLGGLGGSITGGIGTVWKERVDKRRRLDEIRQANLSKWRSELRNPDNRRGHITAIPSWSEIRAVLPADFAEQIEKPYVVMVGGPTIAVLHNHAQAQPMTVHPRVLPWDTVLDHLAEQERKWALA